MENNIFPIIIGKTFILAPKDYIIKLFVMIIKKKLIQNKEKPILIMPDKDTFILNNQDQK